MADVILVVIEDNQSLRESIRELMQVYGMRIHEASLGQDGIELTRSIQPDCVLLDMTLPDMDGFEVIQQLKDDPTTASIPILILSGVIDNDAMNHALELGAAAYLSKPFEPDALINKVQELIDG